MFKSIFSTGRARSEDIELSSRRSEQYENTDTAAQNTERDNEQQHQQAPYMKHTSPKTPPPNKRRGTVSDNTMISPSRSIPRTPRGLFDSDDEDCKSESAVHKDNDAAFTQEAVIDSPTRGFAKKGHFPRANRPQGARIEVSKLLLTGYIAKEFPEERLLRSRMSTGLPAIQLPQHLPVPSAAEVTRARHVMIKATRLRDFAAQYTSDENAAVSQALNHLYSDHAAKKQRKAAKKMQRAEEDLKGESSGEDS